MASSNKEIKVEVVRGPSRWDLHLAIFDYEEKKLDNIVFYQHKQKPMVFTFKEFLLPDYPDFLFGAAEILINRAGHSPFDEIGNNEYSLRIDGTIQQLFWIDNDRLNPFVARYRGKKPYLPTPFISGHYVTRTRTGKLTISDKSWLTEP
ncbi:hypothetical protein KJ853_01585 [Patescibacteria group bacterium]|nr:hypothetical protein [Patescibacteria group bacterium]